jgi:hypothetical protein
MAYSYTWPPTLPQVPQKGFTETGGVLVVRTSQDKGPAKLRNLGQKPQVLNVQFLMTSAQVSTLESFVKLDIKGVARFGFNRPRTNTVVETRIVPQGDGEYYTISYMAPGYWNIQMTLEVLP